MLSADTALEFRSLRAAALDTVLNELADTLGIDCLERISVQEFVSKVCTHECSDIITREAEGHLGKVVGTK